MVYSHMARSHVASPRPPPDLCSPEGERRRANGDLKKEEGCGVRKRPDVTWQFEISRWV